MRARRRTGGLKVKLEKRAEVNKRWKKSRRGKKGSRRSGQKCKDLEV
jgi:hypothetical protein